MRHPDQQIHEDETEVVKSGPASVPAPADGTDGREGAVYDGRHGEPPEDELDERGSYDQNGDDVPDRTAVTTPDESDETGQTDLSEAERAEIADLHGAERPAFHEPAAQPTTFGAATVGGATAAAALAGDTRATEHDVDEVDTDRSGDGATEDRTPPTPDSRDAEDTGDGPDDTADGPDDTADGTDDTGYTTDTETGRAADDRAADPAGGSVPAGPAVDEATPEPVAGNIEAAPAADRDTEVAPAAVGGEAELRPGQAPEEPMGALFAADTAAGFRDRWRDVQLQFVDDPRGAAGAAQQLVEESVEALTSALAEQRERLGAWQGAESEDTEELRVVVRRYRDFLDRLLAL